MQLSHEKEDKALKSLRKLLNAIDSGSFLIIGPDKNIIEKEITFVARRLLCSGKKTEEACNKCNDCQMLISGNHPDLYQIKKEQGSSTVKIEEIRQLKERVNTKSFQSQKKIFIIRDAEFLNVQAANALLKTLEEPPEQAVIILIASSIDQILPTIVSRCKKIRFTSDRLEDEDLEEKRKLIECFFSFDDKKQQEILFEEIIDLQRSQVIDLLQELAFVFRDILMIKINAHSFNLSSNQEEETIRFYAQSYTNDDVEFIIDEILKTRDYIRSNANIKLSLDLLVKIINKKTCSISFY